VRRATHICALCMSSHLRNCTAVSPARCTLRSQECFRKILSERSDGCCAQVLTAFLLSPAHHEQLLPLLRRWPPQLYSVAALTEATLHRCGPVACAAVSAVASCSLHAAVRPLIAAAVLDQE
jgi:hypothetical protein